MQKTVVKGESHATKKCREQKKQSSEKSIQCKIVYPGIICRQLKNRSHEFKRQQQGWRDDSGYQRERRDTSEELEGGREGRSKPKHILNLNVKN